MLRMRVTTSNPTAIIPATDIGIRPSPAVSKAGDAALHQRFADGEHRGDHNHRFAAEAGKQFFLFQDPAQPEREQDEHPDQIEANAVGHQQD